MENVRKISVNLGQVVKTEKPSTFVWKFIKKHKVTIGIGTGFIILLFVYTFLMVQFVQLIKILK